MNIFDTDSGVLSYGDILGSLRKLGIGQRDNLMVHSRLFTIGRPSGSIGNGTVIDSLINAFLEAIGAEGTLIAPTFTLSFCKSGFFDLEKSPSEMGLLSEGIRRHPMSSRTFNPIHSVAVIGKDKDYYLRACGFSSFGTGTIFDLIHKSERVKFLTLGVVNPCEAITHVHYIEQECNVPYRMKKSFSGIVRAGGAEFPQKVDFFVRNPPDRVYFNHDKCFESINNAGICRSVKFGNSVAYLVAEKDYYRVVKKAIEEDANIFANFKEEGQS